VRKPLSWALETQPLHWAVLTLIPLLFISVHATAAVFAFALRLPF